MFKMIKITSLFFCSLVCVFPVIIQMSDSDRSFVINYEKNSFYLDGKPFRYVAGSAHYFRIPHEYWRERLRKMRAGGLNAVTTYVEWSSHEPEEGVYDFRGDLDVVKFIKTAEEEGLLVILRPGPYICAERDLGGLPPWLLKNHDIQLRTKDIAFKTPVTSWMDVLMKKIVPLLYGNGGPIIMVQVENEYGSYGCNINYTSWIRDLFLKYVENKAVLFTTDGNTYQMMKCGKIENVYATVDFGPSADVNVSFQVQRKYEPRGPLVNSEYYPGWLTHWGENMAWTATQKVIDTLKVMLDMGANVNFYMYHGGTNFGFTAGANYGNQYMADITSYDYDAPLTEAGDTTAKYQAIKNLLANYLPSTDIKVVNKQKGKYGDVTLTRTATLFSRQLRKRMGVQTRSEKPKCFEDLNSFYGYVLYETKIDNISSNDFGNLEIKKYGDVANVFVNGHHKGTLSREFKQNLFFVGTLHEGDKLSIIIESLGRINFGNQLHDRKGILSPVTLNGKELKQWEITAFDFKDVRPVIDCKNATEECDNDQGFTFYFAEYVLPPNATSSESPMDTFIDVRSLTKGFVFVNQFNLGRYWSTRKPQFTLYLPGIHLKPHPEKNQIVIMDEFLKKDSVKISFTDKPIFQY